MNEDLLNVMGSFSDTALDCIEKQNEEIEQLQQENQSLKEENKKLKQWDCNKDSRNSRQRVANAKLIKENQSLKDRIEKAIEEIYYLISNCDLTDYQGEKLKQILKGDK